jgi:hypothetical protein
MHANIREVYQGTSQKLKMVLLKISRNRKSKLCPNKLGGYIHPTCHPIEKLWVMLKWRVYRNSCQVQNVDFITAKISTVLKTIEIEGNRRSLKKVPV